MPSSTRPSGARPDRIAVTPLGRRTRAALLEAGRTVAARDGLAAMSVAGVVHGTRVALTAQVEANLRATGWRDAAQAARLVVAMTAEVVLAEHEAGAKQHGARRWLRRFIEHG